MTVDTALDFFSDDAPLYRALKVLQNVGLGYLRLGQSATELSGGEAQRIKLATELQRSALDKTLYIMDEPTTGLHPSDVDRLMSQLNELVDAGNTVVVVEHDMRVVQFSDWVIDIGPGAGDEGGNVIAEGPPNKIIKNKRSITAKYLQRAMSQNHLPGLISAYDCIAICHDGFKRELFIGFCDSIVEEPQPFKVDEPPNCVPERLESRRLRKEID